MAALTDAALRADAVCRVGVCDCDAAIAAGRSSEANSRWRVASRPSSSRAPMPRMSAKRWTAAAGATQLPTHRERPVPVRSTGNSRRTRVPVTSGC